LPKVRRAGEGFALGCFACKRFAEQAKVLRWAVLPAKGSPSRRRFCAGLFCVQKVRRAGEGFALTFLS
jgi:hypothetical protein